MMMDSTQVAEGIYLIVSNAALIPAITLALYYYLYAEAVVLGVLLYSSSVYHLCQAQFYCIFPLQVLQESDHYFVYSTLLWISLYFAGLNLTERFCIYYFFQAFLYPTILRFMKDTVFIIVIIVIIIGITIFAIIFIVQRFPKFSFWEYFITAALIGSGLALHIYAKEPENSTYPIAHATWHVLIMLAIIFIIQIREGKNLFIQNYNLFLQKHSVKKQKISKV